MGEAMTEHRKAEQASDKHWLYGTREEKQAEMDSRSGGDRSHFPSPVPQGPPNVGTLGSQHAKTQRYLAPLWTSLGTPPTTLLSLLLQCYKYMSPNLLIHLAS